jgi:hypothetical protein
LLGVGNELVNNGWVMTYPGFGSDMNKSPWLSDNNALSKIENGCCQS